MIEQELCYFAKQDPLITHIHHGLLSRAVGGTYRGRQGEGGVGGGGCTPDDLVRDGELDLGVVELLDVVTLAHGGRDGGGLDDLDAGEPHAVAGTHLLQHATPQSGGHFQIKNEVPHVRNVDAQVPRCLTKSLSSLLHPNLRSTLNLFLPSYIPN